MKRINPYIFLIALLFSANVFSQQLGFSYQAVAIDRSKAEGFGKDSQGKILADTDVSLRFSLMEASETGTMVYIETHQTATDIFGIFRLVIGRGVTSSSTALEDLQWGIVPYFLQVEIDLGDGFVLMGIEELLGAAYALNNTNQFLTLNGNELSISEGNSVLLNDTDASNELIQKVELIGTSLEITDEGGTTSVDLGSIVSGDNSITNELQSISLSGNTISLSNGGGSVNLPAASVADFNTMINIPANLDIDATDDFDGQYSNLSGAPTVLSSFTNDVGFLTAEVDGSITNEIQDLSLAGNILEITGNASPTSIDLSPYIDAVFATAGGVTSNSPGNLASDDFVFGSSSISNMPGTDDDTRLFFDKSKGAFLAATITDAVWDDANIGQYSVTTGYNSIASGLGAVAMGGLNQATGGATVALGVSSRATADNSIAIGRQAYAGGDISVAIGDNAEAIGSNSSSFGSGTEASGDFSTAIGVQTIATGEASSAFGYYSESTTDFSSSFGYNAHSTADYSIAVGSQISATGQYSTAVGSSGGAVGVNSTSVGTVSITRGSYATAIGADVRAEGDGSVAIGANTESWGNNSSAIGSSVNSWATHSLAIGFDTETNGAYSIAIGSLSRTSGDRSTALGYYSYALGENSVTLGTYLSSHSYGETVMGYWSTNYTPISTVSPNSNDRLFVIGNGTSTTRNNAFVIYKSGNATLDGILTQTSDKRLKKDISTLSGSLSQLSKLDGVYYYWNNVKPRDTTSLQTGFIAQEVEKVFPELVREDSEGYKSVNYTGFIPHLVEAVKTLKQENEQLKAEIALLLNEQKQDEQNLEDRLIAIEQLLNIQEVSSSIK